MKKLRIYISGPMSGKDNYLNDFLQATQTIRSAGHIPVNPAALETVFPDAEREEYLKLDRRGLLPSRMAGKPRR